MKIVLEMNTAEFSAALTWIVFKDSNKHYVLYFSWGVDNYICVQYD